MTNREIKEFLKPGDEHYSEAIGIYEAFMTGKCDNCEYEKDCTKPGNDDFDFPPDAWCMKRKKEILDDWRKENGCSVD